LALRVTYGIGLAVVAACLLATHSRAGLFAGAVGATAVVLLYAIKRRGVLDLIAAPVLIAAGAVVFLLYGQGVIDRLGTVESSADDRLALYSQVFTMIRDRWLVGFGANSLELAFPRFHELPLSADVVWNKAHDTYLALWAELGLVGGTLLLLVVASAAGRCISRIVRASEPDTVTIASLGALVVAMLHSTVDFSLEIQADAILFLVVVALGVGRSLSPTHHRAKRASRVASSIPLLSVDGPA
jgi:O-antigen ligase